MDIVLNNLVPIAIAVAVIFFLVARSRRQKVNALIQEQQQKAAQDASSAGLNITEQSGTNMRAGEVLGDTSYEGTTGGIAWTLTSSLQRGRKSSIYRKSIWRTNNVTLPDKKFILVVSTSGDMKIGEIKRGGLMNTLINKAADAMLDFYVMAYFGSEYKTLVNIGEDAVKIQRAALSDFAIITNYPEVAEKFFDDSTVSVIAGWKQGNQGFQREQQVDQFGLLFAPDRMLLACQANMTTPAEVKAFSDFGAVLAVKMKQLQEISR